MRGEGCMASYVSTWNKGVEWDGWSVEHSYMSIFVTMLIINNWV